mmetsp:Transcript_38305/g.105491  ORF Transcript_38305/g.105491 Transcript_38305/m.105491 type:complete len:292 (+) Transcript_38305:974-1849(+)
MCCVILASLQEEIPQDEPILRELRCRGRPGRCNLLPSRAKQSAAVQREHVRVHEGRCRHARHADGIEAITPPHEERLVPEHVQEAARVARGVAIRRDAARRYPRDGDVAICAGHLQQPLDGELRRVLRENGEVTRWGDADVPVVFAESVPHASPEVGLKLIDQAPRISLKRDVVQLQCIHRGLTAFQHEARGPEGRGAKAVLADRLHVGNVFHGHASRRLAHNDHFPKLREVHHHGVRRRRILRNKRHAEGDDSPSAKAKALAVTPHAVEVQGRRFEGHAACPAGYICSAA